ncbi:immunoglobulin-like domain-containing protein [Paenibacillus sp. NPDC056579]|uniref:immunoglobulin-like domain-containing protein n=1 Tax=Paenibacillus sp. NPDC056579 TaxID=3345871 RepID=UPI003682EE46
MAFGTSNKLRQLLKRSCTVLAAGALLVSAVAGFTSGTAHAAPVNLEADYAVNEGPLVRTEQFNNTNYTPLPVHVVDELKGIRTKVVRDFVKINWYYNKDEANSDYLAYSIDDPRNATNPDLQHGRKETYDFMSQFADAILLSLAYSYGGDANPQRNRVLAGETSMNWPEFDKAMKKIIYTLKEKNPKIEYIEVGNEPNLEPAYYGHVKDDIPGYMRMYQGMSEAVKWVNTQGLAGQPLKVGGPVLSGYNFEKQKQFVDLAYNAGYQVDFVSWHRYQEDVRMNETQEIEMKSYLHKFYPNATTIVSEYGWKGGGGLSDPTNNVGLAKQAAFMTDSAYYYARGGTDIPMNWVAVHTLNAYFKNQFDVDYALSSGDTKNWQTFLNPAPRALQYLNLRGWRESASSSKPMKIKEIRFFDSGNNPIPIPNPANDPNIAAVTDGDDATQFTQADYWTWLKFDLGPSAPGIARVDIKWGNADINTFQLIGTSDKLKYYEVLGRTFFTPYFNTMRMFARLGDTRVKATGGSGDIYGTRMLATKNSDSKATMMVWNKQGDRAASSNISLSVKHLPPGFEGKSVRIKKYLVDETHSNYAYNKIDELQLVDETLANTADNLTLSATLDKNSVMLIELEAVDPSIQNIVSAGKPVTSATGMSNTAALVDGNSLTAAVAANGSYPQTIQIDLGRPYELAGMQIDWTNSASRGYSYAIATSLDGTAYHTAADRTHPASIASMGNSLEWFQTKARYVKLTVTGSTFDGPLSINDVKIFAEALYKNGFDTAEETNAMAAWTTVGFGSKSTPWTTVSDSVYHTAYVQPTDVYGTTPSFALFGDNLKDYGIEARVKTSDSGNVQMGLIARATDYNNLYYFKLQRSGSTHQAVLEKRVNGTTTVLKTGDLAEPIQSNRWYKLNLEAVGTTLRASIDGVQVIELTDASRTSGKFGLRSHESIAGFDDVKVYPIVPLLGDIKVNGMSIEGFHPLLNNYTVLVPSTSSAVTVTASVYGTANALASPASGQVTFDAVGQEKPYTVAALSSEGNGANYYKINLRTASADTSLSSLRLSVISDPLTAPGRQLPETSIALVPNQTEYTIRVPSRTAYVKVVEAIPTASNVATVQITDAVLVNGSGTATVKVTSEAGTAAEYKLNILANPETAAGTVLYEENFENGAYNQDEATGWNNGAVPNGAASHLRVADEDRGKVLEKYTTASMAFTVGQSGWSNYDVRARVKAQASPSLPGIIARASDDAKNFYMLRIHNGTNGLPGGSTGYIVLGRVVNGTLRELDSKKIPYPYVVGNWYQLRLVVDGNRIKGYVDDSLIYDEVDSGTLFPTNPPALTQGKAGIRVANQAARIDDLQVSGLAAIPADTVKPVITLNGPAAVEIPAGSTYTDAGATATDNVDGDLTSRIQVNGSVDTSLPGTYTLIYTVTDNAQNAADPVVRTVTVAAAVDKPFTVAAHGGLNRMKGLSAKVDVVRTAGSIDHAEEEVVYFQLLKGSTPVAHVALESELANGSSLTGHFDVPDAETDAYTVHVFIVDKLDSMDGTLPIPLSNKVIVK